LDIYSRCQIRLAGLITTDTASTSTTTINDNDTVASLIYRTEPKKIQKNKKID